MVRMNDFFQIGYDWAEAIVDREGVSAEFQIEDLAPSALKDFVDGVIQRFSDRLRAIDGIRYCGPSPRSWARRSTMRLR